MAAEMEACLRLLSRIDPDRKVTLLPGPFACPGEHPQLGETRQRNAALALASERGDWVLQLDTDEVATNASRLFHEIGVTDGLGVSALEYPARWLYTHVGWRIFLERSRRSLRVWDAIPGPVAVRAGTVLRLARQTDVLSRRLAIGRGPTPERLRLRDAILHFSMVRSFEAMNWKASVSPHAPDLDWKRRLDLWTAARRHPARAVAISILNPTFGSYRPTLLPTPFDASTVEMELRIGDAGRFPSQPHAPTENE
jgi:hypothetical protein